MLIAGTHWPIPQSQLLDGSVIILKNAHNLLQASKTLLENKQYPTALSIATLALEEFGKHCLIMNDFEKKKELDRNRWSKKYEDHKSKLMAIPTRLRKFSNPQDRQKNKKLNEMEKYLLKLSTNKLEALYVDWDAKKN